MNRTSLWIFWIIFLIGFIESMFQDHIVIWDINNHIFSSNKTILKVKEGDNIVFVCATETMRTQKLFWTSDAQTFRDCIPPKSIQVLKLFECSPGRVNEEFILKVAQFSEIAYLPQFQEGKLVYFLGQQDICSLNNLRLAVQLVTDSVNEEISAGPDTTSQTPALFVDRSQLPSDNSYIYQSDLERAKSDMYLSPWTRYRFLLIPGSLGLLTLIGIKAVICALWHPKRSSQTSFCCPPRKRSSPQHDRTPRLASHNNNNKDKNDRDNNNSPNRLFHCLHTLTGKAPTSNQTELCKLNQSFEIPQWHKSVDNDLKHPTEINSINHKYHHYHHYHTKNSDDMIKQTNYSDPVTTSKHRPPVHFTLSSELPISSSPTTQLSTCLTSNNCNIQVYTCNSLDGNLTCLVPVSSNHGPPPAVLYANLVKLEHFDNVINIAV